MSVELRIKSDSRRSRASRGAAALFVVQPRFWGSLLNQVEQIEVETYSGHSTYTQDADEMSSVFETQSLSQHQIQSGSTHEPQP